MRSIKNGILKKRRDKDSLLEDQLTKVVNMLKSCKPGEFYENDKLSFLLDDSFNEARAFLVELIQGDKVSLACQAYKVLFLLGLARASIEDLLLLCSFLAKEKRADVDLREELEHLKNICDQVSSKDEDFDPGNTLQLFDRKTLRMCCYGTVNIKNALTYSEEKNDRIIVQEDKIYILNFEAGLIRMSKSSMNGLMAG